MLRYLSSLLLAGVLPALSPAHAEMPPQFTGGGRLEPAPVSHRSTDGRFMLDAALRARPDAEPRQDAAGRFTFSATLGAKAGSALCALDLGAIFSDGFEAIP